MKEQDLKFSWMTITANVAAVSQKLVLDKVACYHRLYSFSSLEELHGRCTSKVPWQCSCIGKKITNTWLKDDIDLMEESPEGIQEIKRKLEEAMKKHRMEICSDK